MKIEVFGPGCPKCHDTEKIIREVLRDLAREAEVTAISDITEMVDRGVMFTPAVMIDGKKVCEGKVPTRDMVKGWLK